MQYLIISFTHKNTSINLREKLSFSSIKSLENILLHLQKFPHISESVVLSTCNRVEIITSIENVDETLEYIFQALSSHANVSQDELSDIADIYQDESAVHHLFAVASSLDSLAIGETQIVGQLKDAFRFSFEHGFCSQKIARLMHKAFKCAAKIRENTDISRSPVSVASVAVSQAKELLGNMGGLTAIIIGAGEMSALVAKHLIANEVNVIILSRNKNRSEQLAKELGDLASADEMSRLEKYLNRYRIFFSATSANEPIITSDMLENRDYDRYFFDIAVPRDVDLKQSKNIHVFAVDDLQGIVAKNMSFREKQAREAFKIVREETVAFYVWLRGLEVEPVIKQIRLKAKTCAKAEIKKACKKGYIRHCDQYEVEKIIHQVFQSFLHDPTINLKSVAQKPEGDNILQAMQYIFALGEEKLINLNRYKCEYSMEN